MNRNGARHPRHRSPDGRRASNKDRLSGETHESQGLPVHVPNQLRARVRQIRLSYWWDDVWWYSFDTFHDYDKAKKTVAFRLSADAVIILYVRRICWPKLMLHVSYSMRIHVLPCIVWIFAVISDTRDKRGHEKLLLRRNVITCIGEEGVWW